MTTNQRIAPSQLPDYPQIKKLASALHRLDASHHGAAIMIGAGFSSSAATHVEGNKRVPLWNQFTSRLVEKLYPGRNVSFADPLRIAEEFRAYFGQSVLNDQIRFEIQDDAWRNGPLYKALLSLPWTDVLTTNWDTLLERAAEDLSSPYYTTVTKCSDLAWAPSPRIVKLHGTIGVTDELIAAQEDYRQYPARFAPFVNLTRQVFIENELCLLGFSGDDPNFLAWAGWVRDHLADHSRKIYLVGALNLAPARRKQLEAMNIAPIDLAPLVEDVADVDLRHERATRIFLDALRDELSSRVSPRDWRPTQIPGNVSGIDEIRSQQKPEIGAARLTAQLQLLKETRESYPGWLICPPSIRWTLANQICSPRPNPKMMEALEPQERARLLYELCWRRSVALEPIEPWLAGMLQSIADPAIPSAISARQQLEIALVLLNHCRWLPAVTKEERDAVDAIRQSLIVPLEKFAEYLPDSVAEVAYHRALVCRDRLDHAGIASLVEKVAGEDPVWSLRRAALLSELGRSEEAMDAIARSYGGLLKSHRSDRRSIPILSRLVWAHWLLRAAQSVKFSSDKEELPAFAEQNYRFLRCDPWSYFEDIREKLSASFEKHVERQMKTEALFQQGRYRDLERGDSNDDKWEELRLIDGLSRIVGIPMRLTGSAGMNLLSDEVRRVLQTGGTGDELVDTIWAIRAASKDDSKSIKQYFTRVRIAKSDSELVNLIVVRVRAALLHWRGVQTTGSPGERVNARQMLSVMLEVLSRLAVRVPPESAKELFRFAVSLATSPDMQHGWVSESLGHLAINALKSVPPPEQADLLPDALGFPLTAELSGQHHPGWPNPRIRGFHDRSSYPYLDARISELIQRSEESAGSFRSEALLRLLRLCGKSGFLRQDESDRLAAAIWGTSPDFSRVPNTGLLPHVLLGFPSRDPSRVEEVVRAELFVVRPETLGDTQKELNRFPSAEFHRAISWCEGISGAALSGPRKLLPTPAQAVAMFEELVRWRPNTRSTRFFSGSEDKNLAGSIGRALSTSVVRSMRKSQRTKSRFEALLEFNSQADGATSVLPGLIAFLHLGTEAVNATSRLLRAAIHAPEHTKVFYASIAIGTWSEVAKPKMEPSLDGLVSLVLAVIESEKPTALQQLIWLANKLAASGWLASDQLVALKENLLSIYESMAYENIQPSDTVMVNGSTIRYSCVLLAKTLLQRFPSDSALLELLVRARQDALPEVRFAEFAEY